MRPRRVPDRHLNLRKGGAHRIAPVRTPRARLFPGQHQAVRMPGRRVATCGCSWVRLQRLPTALRHLRSSANLAQKTTVRLLVWRPLCAKPDDTSMLRTLDEIVKAPSHLEKRIIMMTSSDLLALGISKERFTTPARQFCRP